MYGVVTGLIFFLSEKCYIRFLCADIFLLDSDLGLHICFEFSQHPLMFISSYANTEMVLCVENTTIKRDVFL